jgi:hypothetical protein
MDYEVTNLESKILVKVIGLRVDIWTQHLQSKKSGGNRKSGPDNNNSGK